MFVLTLAGICALAMAQREVATYSPTLDVPLPAKELEFRQVPEGILIVTRHLPLAIHLPSKLPEYPGLRWFSHFGPQGPEPGENMARYCAGKPGCDKWIERSLRKRALLRQLLSRGYVLRSGRYQEVDSTAAWRAMASLIEVEADSPVLAMLAAKHAPRIVNRTHGSAGGQGVLLQWDTLAAQTNLELKYLPIGLTTESGRVHEVEIELARPRRYHYSPCHLPLTVLADRLYGQEQSPGFYLPQKEGQVDAAFGWALPIGERAWGAGSAGTDSLTPQVLIQESVFTHLGGERYVCGPMLKVRNGPAETAIGQPPDLHFIPGGFRVAALQDGTLLVLKIPRIHAFKIDGMGYCGSAPVVEWKVLRVAALPSQPGTYPNLIQQASGAEQMLYCGDGNPADYGVEFSEDLKTIIEYRTEDEPDRRQHWNARQLTWTGKGYSASPWKPSQAPKSGGFRRKAH